eukprot:CAMPEP_0171339994 /NCGR_PEP_ID=MMETSP0878-20121228/8287_1 /TAXON_ID=67004 /ORGANISM="Thalassiosira weissflogii, Strain CCMP1336" /LENGTH=85 /DNA_ID=CAMNT_0011841989 /DNA_START=51 /DNA_END=308 /DNA_ORIENTATION=+
MATAQHTDITMNESEQQQELEHLRRECASMVSTLKTLHEEEVLLRKSNEVLAQQAVLMGCRGGLDGGTKRARKASAGGAKKADKS